MTAGAVIIDTKQIARDMLADCQTSDERKERFVSLLSRRLEREFRGALSRRLERSCRAALVAAR